MSMQRTLARGTIDVKTQKALYQAAVREAISVFKRRMHNWIHAATSPVPFATGTLQDSSDEVMARSNVIGSKFEVFIGYSAPHAPYVEEGRSPGSFPPIADILAWCITVGIPPSAAESVAWKIYHYGIAPQPFFNATIGYARNVLTQELNRSLIKFKLLGSVTQG